jgi:hypothetical protein
MIELKSVDYWAVMRLFEEIFERVRSSPGDFQWDDTMQRIRGISQPLQQKFAKTLAAFGIEVHLCQR